MIGPAAACVFERFELVPETQILKAGDNPVFASLDVDVEGAVNVFASRHNGNSTWEQGDTHSMIAH
jgi:hypothetical protein